MHACSAVGVLLRAVATSFLSGESWSWCTNWDASCSCLSTLRHSGRFSLGHAAQHNPDVNVLIHISLPCGGGQDLGQWCLLPEGRHALTADKSLLWAQVTAINNTGPANLTGGGGHTINGSQVYSVVCPPGLCSACLSTWQPQVERRPTEQLPAHLLSHLQEISLWALLACQSRAIRQCSTTAALPICLWRPKPQASRTGCTCIDV